MKELIEKEMQEWAKTLRSETPYPIIDKLADLFGKQHAELISVSKDILYLLDNKFNWTGDLRTERLRKILSSLTIK